MKRRPGAPHGTLGEQLGHETSPEGAARQCWGTIWGRNVALETGGLTGGFMGRLIGGLKEESSATESSWNVA